MATIKRNIVREWNALALKEDLEIVGDYSYPSLGGHRAAFVRDPKGRAWVRRDRNTAAAIVAIVPSCLLMRSARWSMTPTMMPLTPERPLLSPTEPLQ